MLDILNFNQDDYTPYAISVINEILKEREVSSIDIENSNQKYQEISSNIEKTNSQKRVPVIPRTLLWILSIASLAILLNFRDVILKAWATQLSNSSTSVKTSNTTSMVYFTDSLENSIRTHIINDSSVAVSKKVKIKYCDCYIRGLRSFFPRAVNKDVPDDSIKLIANQCLMELSKH